ncbi:MAG: 50S ribosomal protein L19 [Candidatus Colwellbacteria bacterium]|nr:50S ribosomal protein L19 [Candidatus Colwellbacteria bacterium]
MINQETLARIKPGVRIRVHDNTGQLEGIVLARKHGQEAGGTFTIMGEVAGVGVEKTYPIYSPVIKKVYILKEPTKVRRSKLYFLRNLSVRGIRQKLGV